MEKTFGKKETEKLLRKHCSGSDPDPRMRITDYGSGSESGSFRQWLSRCQQKIIFLTKFFCLLLKLLSVHVHQSSQIKKSLGSHKGAAT
jgi:hypothetical protein